MAPPKYSKHTYTRWLLGLAFLMIGIVALLYSFFLDQSELTYFAIGFLAIWGLTGIYNAYLNLSINVESPKLAETIVQIDRFLIVGWVIALGCLTLAFLHRPQEFSWKWQLVLGGCIFLVLSFPPKLFKLSTYREAFKFIEPSES
ncbi:MAG: hypothetical protein AAF694_23640 [Bacteroidota bacterium]